MNTSRTPESVNHSTSAEKVSPTAAIGLREDAFAVPIIQEIEKRTGRQVFHAAVYIALRHLEAES